MDTIFETMARMFSGTEGKYAIALVIFLCFYVVGDFVSVKPSLGTAYWAGSREKLNALNTAMKQLQQKKHNKVTLYLGTPKYNIFLDRVPSKATTKKKLAVRFKNFKIANSARIRTIFGNPATYFIPSANRGIGIPGATGSGKSYTASDPLIRSALQQGIPIICYDLKCEQARRHAAYAMKLGYEVYFFAPGKKYSHNFNFLDYIRSDSDSVRAGEIASIINANSKIRYKNAKGDEYFGPAGDKLIELVLLLAKTEGIPDADLLQAWSFISLPDLGKKLEAAIDRGDILNFTQELCALNFARAAKSEKTAASVISTAINIFSSFCKTEFLPNLLETNIPMKLDGKQIIFLQPDEMAESITVPLVAAVFHCLVKINLNNQYKRSLPIYISIDEAPSFYGDYDKWMNRYREYGAIFSLAYQNFDQFANTYGVHASNAIVSATLTNLIFNPNHEATAAGFSRLIGNTEIKRRVKSNSYGKNNRSSSSSEQYHLTPLITPDSINSFDEGEFILRNPEYKNGLKNKKKRAFIPWHISRGEIPKKDIKIQENSEKVWDNSLEKYFSAIAAKQRIRPTEAVLRAIYSDRKILADCYLPSKQELKYRA